MLYMPAKCAFWENGCSCIKATKITLTIEIVNIATVVKCLVLASLLFNVCYCSSPVTERLVTVMRLFKDCARFYPHADRNMQGLNNQWNRWSESQSINDNRCQLIDWYRWSMNNRCSGFLWLSISTIINFNRLSMPIDQLVDEFKSQTFVRTAKWVYVRFWMCGIRRYFNANRWRSMNFDNFCVIIDWPMPIN